MKDKKRCVDDSLLYSKTLEKAFLQAASYLSLMGTNRIIQNPDKFQFGSKEVEWAGFFLFGYFLLFPHNYSQWYERVFSIDK